MSESLLSSYTPSDFGLDSNQFPSFREIQCEAVDFVLNSDHSVDGLVVPGGGGKTLLAWMLHKVTGKRTAIVTMTNSLTAQYQRDFARYALTEIKGKDNYDCGEFAELTCRGGMSMGCRFVGGNGCEYERAKAEARNRDSVITNYAYWMSVNDKAQGLERTMKEGEARGENPIELLILDEAHDSVEALSNYLHVTLYEKELLKFDHLGPRPTSENIREWGEWVELASLELEQEIRTTGMELVHLGKRATSQQVGVLHQLERLLSKFDRVVDMKKGEDGICEYRQSNKWGRLWGFDVLWPGRYFKQYLQCGVPKVVMMSATMTKKVLHQQGMKSGEFGFREWRRVFPISRNPVYLMPAKKRVKPTTKNPSGVVSIGLRFNTSEDDLKAVIHRMDEIVSGRLDRKGLIQVNSYDLQRFAMTNSIHKEVMIGNTDDPESPNAIAAATRHRKAKPPSVLISPSFSTGWDFRYSECEYIIIVKVPFVPAQSKVMKEREERDKEYGLNLAMQKLVQSSMRGMRAEDDQCEVFIIDGQADWFLFQNQHLAPNGWVRDVRRGLTSIPRPPKRLERVG